MIKQHPQFFGPHNTILKIIFKIKRKRINQRLQTCLEYAVCIASPQSSFYYFKAFTRFKCGRFHIKFYQCWKRKTNSASQSCSLIRAVRSRYLSEHQNPLAIWSYTDLRTSAQSFWFSSKGGIWVSASTSFLRLGVQFKGPHFKTMN